MASTNQSPFYQKAEAKFLSAQNPEDKIKALEEMIRECPKHKSSENMLANLTTRYKKLKQQLAKSKKSGKSGKVGIKKEDIQAVIIGFVNVGKSSLLSNLTNAKPTISPENSEVIYTKNPEIGMINYLSGLQIQLIEIPAFESEYYDKGTINTADVILILVTNLEQISKIKKELNKAKGKQMIVFNKSDNLNEQEKRKISATLQSKKYNFVLVSMKTKEGLEELKDKIFQNCDKIRVYTKEPKKEKSNKPIIMKKNSTVKEIAEKILTGFSDKIKETKIWGPSSKFSGQVVGLNHKLKDLDVVEFKTK
jgi:hypothetical protein|tara:strand:+ start:7748 stop:8671 length:924 start_codon:yes stop_codon:yes gene_type:complete